MLEAWYLPGFDAASVEWQEAHTTAGLAFRAPVLSSSDAGRMAHSVVEAAAGARRTRTTEDVIRSVSAAAARLTGDTPEGHAARQLLRAELGWGVDLAADTLDGMAGIWSRDALVRLVEVELGSTAVLDGFARDERWPGPGRRSRRAVGPLAVLQVLAGNVPGVAITATIRALIARSGVLCKLPASEPGLLPAFCRLLAEEDPQLGGLVAATWWSGARYPVAWRQWTKRAGAAVVYGDAATIESVRQNLPAGIPLVAYGPKTGVAVALPDASARAARDLAADVLAYDQQGCVSPRMVYVLGDSTRHFVEALSDALREETTRQPPPDPSDEEAMAIRAARAMFEFEGYEDNGSSVVAPGDSLAWTILVSERPTTVAESLPRVVWVQAVQDLEALAEALEGLDGRIQTLGYAGTVGLADLATLAARLGVSRVAPFGSVAWPPVDWRHDGRHQLLPLLNWTDFETLK